MSSTPFRALLVSAGLAVLTAPLAAQAPKGDLLDQVKQRSEISAQKMEADVRDALADAQRLSGSDPVRALARLLQTLSALEADRALTQARRDLLTRQMKDRIKVAEVEADKFARRTNETNNKLANQDVRTKEAEQRDAQTILIQRQLDYIGQLQKAGNTAQANRAAEDFFRKYPTLATPAAVGRTSSALDQVAYVKGLQSDMSGRWVAAMNTIDKSALSPGNDMEFPKNWHEIATRRKALETANVSAKEKQILNSLGKTLSVDYDKVGFMDVIEDLSTRLGQPILLDKGSLADLQITSDTPVNFKVRGVSGRTILRRVLGDVGLAYIIKDDAIQVVTEKQARETMITRTYYLGSLLEGGPFSAAGIRFVPGLTQFEGMQNVMSIVQMIQGSVDPQSWQANGGKGTITFYAPSMSLIIRNTAEVHGMMSGYLR
jgi:hypothetical protein